MIPNILSQVLDQQTIFSLQVIQSQTIQVSFSGLLDPYKSNNIMDFLTEEEQAKLKMANEEWIKIKMWVDARLDTLNRADEFWDDFKVN